MVREIYLEKLQDFDMQRLGERPKLEHVAEVIDEDCDVYLPDGSLGVAFRKGYFSERHGVIPGSDNYKYWQWACRSLLSDQRGMASGKDIYTNVEIRCTYGQNEFFRLAAKGLVADLEQALAIVNADPRPSRTTYYVGKAEKAGLVDLE